MASCSHLGTIVAAPPSDDGCTDCLAMGASWVHLRRCAQCGHVGCCDSSPNTHATRHSQGDRHPLVQSFEPGEDWFWCYQDEEAFELPDHMGSPAHS